MIRVTAGTLRGRRIPVPAGQVRPTSERARQALFDIFGTRIVDASFLDLFAGSGIFSFEAISRGARDVLAIDSSRAQTGTIRRIATELGVSLRADTADALAAVRRLESERFDLVYADPPYDWPDHRALVEAIDGHLGLAADAVIAVEHRRRSEPFAALTDPSTTTLKRLSFWRRAEYGEVWITFFIT